MTREHTHELQQTHWVNRDYPGAVPPGMEHAIIIGNPDGSTHVTTIDSLVTRGNYGPRVDLISPDETLAVVCATDEDMATAERYEQNIRGIAEWSSRGDSS